MIQTLRLVATVIFVRDGKGRLTTVPIVKRVWTTEKPSVRA